MSDAKLHSHFASVLQKTIDEDMAELATEMAIGTGYNSGKKPLPAFQHVDVFERQRIDKEMRRRQDEYYERKQQQRMVQPNPENQPEIMVVLPDE